MPMVMTWGFKEKTFFSVPVIVKFSVIPLKKFLEEDRNEYLAFQVLQHKYYVDDYWLADRYPLGL